MERFSPDYYHRLGLYDGADEKQIRAAYRLLARRYHPDAAHSTMPAAESERFLAIQEAYETLSNADRHADYDRWLASLPPDKRLTVQIHQTIGPLSLATLREPQAATLLLDMRVDSALRPKHLPLNLCLVIDRSSSMRGPRLSQVRRATKEIVDQLEPDDVFSLITFSDRATVILPSHRNLRKEVAKSLIDAIEASGGTEIYQGLQEGMNQVLRYHEPDTLSHLILLTDGHTYGDAEQCLSIAEQAGNRHIAITSLGIGTDWNDQFLDSLARASHGTASYIAGPTQVIESFQNQMNRLRAIAGRGATLSLTPAPKTTVRDAYLVSPEVDALSIIENQIPLGGLSFDHSTVVLVELVIDPLPASVQELLRWTLAVDMAPLTRRREQISREVLVDVRNQEFPLETPEVVISAQSRLTAYKLRSQAWRDMEQGQPLQACKRLQAVATRLFDLHETELALATLHEAEHVKNTGTLTRDRGKWIKYGTRRLALPAPGDVP